MLCENLERRTLFSAHVTYGFGTLIGYTAAGTSENYDVTYDVSSDLTGDRSGSGEEQLSVSRNKKHKKEYNVEFSNSDDNSTTTLAVASTANGLGVAEIDSTVNGSPLHFDIGFSNTSLGPSTLAKGQKFSSSGTFAINDTSTISGEKIALVASGTSTTSARLYTGSPKITVPDGTFTTVKGAYSVTASGTLSAVVNGKKAKGKFTETVSTVFWAKPGGGIVEFQSTVEVKLDLGSQGSATVTSTESGQLD